MNMKKNNKLGKRIASFIKSAWHTVVGSGAASWSQDESAVKDQLVFECKVCGSHLLIDPTVLSKDTGDGCEFCKGVNPDEKPVVKKKATKKKATKKKSAKKKSTKKKED